MLVGLVVFLICLYSPTLKRPCSWVEGVLSYILPTNFRRFLSSPSSFREDSFRYMFPTLHSSLITLWPEHVHLKLSYLVVTHPLDPQQVFSLFARLFVNGLSNVVLTLVPFFVSLPLTLPVAVFLGLSKPGLITSALARTSNSGRILLK